MSQNVKASSNLKKSLRSRRRLQLHFTEPSRTKQSFKDECDINLILKKAASTGQLPDLIKQNPQYGDFSNPLTYQESLNIVLHAESQFAALSSHVRERFNNDPLKFLEFTSNPKNLPEMVALGLATRTQPNDSNDPNVPNPQAPKTPKETSKKPDENS